MSDADLSASAAESSGMRSRKPGATASNGADGLEVQLPTGKPRSSAPPADSASSSSSSTAAAFAAASITSPPSTAVAHDQAGHSIGFTTEGSRFDVPETLNTAEVFLPHNLSVGSVFSLCCVLATAYITFLGSYSKWVNIAIFLFWRASYDLGLGLILRAQSEHKSFYKLYLKIYAQGGWKAQLLDHLAVRQLPSTVRDSPSTPIQSFPQEFRCWLVYKNLVNIILVNDGLTYLMLGVKCFHWPAEFTMLVAAQYLVGLFLGAFNYWAKVDAHRCIGEYCWYWGDFFFRKDLHLTFDGIFELFPHPMYTVGYSLYYGYSLMARSYTLLFVSLIAHCAQLAFLFFVEEPHIKRTYGSPPPLDKSKSSVLYDPKSGWFPNAKDNLFLANFDLFRSGDFAVFWFSLYALALAWLPTNPAWALAQVVVWRVIHWVGLGAVLWGQSNYQLWTRHFTTRGRTIYEAFGHWKNTYNLSLTMNVVVFIAAAIRYGDFSWNHLFSGFAMACFAVGCVLICLSVWSFVSTYEAVGEFGWFYGDFFISEDSFRNHLCYTGIYRFLNNPDAVTGYAGQYGLALMAQSWPIFFLAVGSHVLNVLFLNLVEIPHMHKLYSQKEMRAEAPFPKALKRIQDVVIPPALQKAQGKIERNIKTEVHRIRTKAMEEVWQVYKKLSDARRASQQQSAAESSSNTVPASPSATQRLASPRAPAGGVTVLTPERVTLGEGMTVQYSSRPEVGGAAVAAASGPKKGTQVSSSSSSSSQSTGGKSSYDWIGVYPVEVSSAPGASEGLWMYVEPAEDGAAVFPATLLPSVEGVYEARYFRRNGYEVAASHPFMLVQAEPAQPEGSPAPSPSPSPRPLTVDEE